MTHEKNLQCLFQPVSQGLIMNFLKAQSASKQPSCSSSSIVCSHFIVFIFFWQNFVNFGIFIYVEDEKVFETTFVVLLHFSGKWLSEQFIIQV